MPSSDTPSIEDLRILWAQIRASAGPAAQEVATATRRIAGFQPEPWPDLDELEAWLNRLDGGVTQATDGTASHQIRRWQVAADAFSQQVRDDGAAAQAGMDRRNHLRDCLSALETKAAELGRRDEAQVDDILADAYDGLWTAPCDLQAAETLLSRLTALLDGVRPPGG
jgi:plasmid stability protein